MSRVIVGVDDSPESCAALAWSIDYAEKTGASLHVVSVVPFLVLSGTLWSDRPADSTVAAHLAATRSEVGRLLKQCEIDRERPLACPIDVHPLVGHPVGTLVGLSEDADLLVVGSRRPGPASRLALGSVADAVAHHARCPVAVIRGEPINSSEAKRCAHEHRRACWPSPLH